MSEQSCSITADDSSGRPEPHTPERGWRRLLANSFGIDTRTLALFRVGAALLILFDLVTRAQDLRAHYAGSGVFGTGAMAQTVGPTIAKLSPYYWAAPSPILVALLFVLAGLFAVGMLVGYRTRLFTFLSWLMLTALHIRNPEVIGGGDALFRLMLLWAIFLPLGARWSFDAAVNTAPDRNRRRVLSIASAALLLQLAFMYWFSVLMKFGPSWWTGEALWRAIQMDFLIEGTGMWLRHQHELTRWMTHGTLILEVFGPLLVFSPVWTARIRIVIIPIFIAFHVGISMTMMVAFFPFAATLAWLAFLPGGFWNFLMKRLETARRRGAVIYYDEDCGFCKRMVRLVSTFLVHPVTRDAPAQSAPEIERQMREHNSWVFVDHTGKSHFRYEAFIRLCRLSPIWLIAYPASLAMSPIGRPAYRWIANNRDKAGRIAVFLNPRRIQVAPGRFSQALAGVLLAYVFIQNWGECGSAYATYLERDPLKQRVVSPVPPEWIYKIGAAVNPPDWMRSYAGMALLNQRWTLFAPEPRAADMWYVWTGLTADGDRVDLWRLRDEPTWEEPSLADRDIPTMRWHAYLAHPPDPNSANGQARIRNMIKWAKDRWEEGRGPEDRLIRIDLHLFVEPTGPDGPGRPRDIVLGSWQGG